MKVLIYVGLVALLGGVTHAMQRDEDDKVICHSQLSEYFQTLEEGRSAGCTSDMMTVDEILSSCFVEDPFRLLIQMKRIFDDFTIRHCISADTNICNTDRLHNCMNLMFDDSWFHCKATEAALICLEGLRNDSCQTLQAIKMQFSILSAGAVYCADVPIACVNQYGLWHAVQGTECRKFTREVHGTGQTFNFDAWKGTKFDTRICGQQHEAQVPCAI